MESTRNTVCYRIRSFAVILHLCRTRKHMRWKGTESAGRQIPLHCWGKAPASPVLSHKGKNFFFHRIGEHVKWTATHMSSVPLCDQLPESWLQLLPEEGCVGKSWSCFVQGDTGVRWKVLPGFCRTKAVRCKGAFCLKVYFVVLLHCVYLLTATRCCIQVSSCISMASGHL